MRTALGGAVPVPESCRRPTIELHGNLIDYATLELRIHQMSIKAFGGSPTGRRPWPPAVQFVSPAQYERWARLLQGR